MRGAGAASSRLQNLAKFSGTGGFSVLQVGIAEIEKARQSTTGISGLQLAFA